MKLTPQQVHQFLEARLGQNITGITPVSGGEWSQAFFFGVNGSQKVVRFSNINEDFKRDQFAYRFNSPKLPIPQIEEIGQVFDGYFAISSKAEGQMIDNLNSKEVRATLPALLDLLNSLWSLDTSQTTGFGGWSPEGTGTKSSWREFLVDIHADSSHSRLSGWQRKLASHKVALETFNQAYEKLLDIVNFCPEDRYVIHNDLLHFNLLVKNNHISAVIDWGCAKYGDFLYDLAMFTTWQFYYPAMQGIDFKNEAKNYFAKRNVDLTHFEERLKCYEIHLLLDSLVYSSFKENWSNVNMITKRLSSVINNYGP